PPTTHTPTHRSRNDLLSTQAVSKARRPAHTHTHTHCLEPCKHTQTHTHTHTNAHTCHKKEQYSHVVMHVHNVAYFLNWAAGGLICWTNGRTLTKSHKNCFRMSLSHTLSM